MVSLSRTYTRPLLLLWASALETSVCGHSLHYDFRILQRAWEPKLHCQERPSGVDGIHKSPSPPLLLQQLALSPFCLSILFRVIVIYDFPKLGEDLVDDIFELLKPIWSHLRNVVYNNHRVDPICLLRPIFEYITKEFWRSKRNVKWLLFKPRSTHPLASRLIISKRHLL